MPARFVGLLETAVGAALQVLVLTQQAQGPVVLLTPGPSNELLAVGAGERIRVFEPGDIVVHAEEVALASRGVGRPRVQ